MSNPNLGELFTISMATPLQKNSKDLLSIENDAVLIFLKAKSKITLEILIEIQISSRTFQTVLGFLVAISMTSFWEHWNNFIPS